jgi:hypothetical protein
MGTTRAYARLTCYCKDCRAFARFVGLPGVLDASGGATSRRWRLPREHVVCMRSERASPFLNDSGHPLRAPEVISREQRAALKRDAG